MVQCGKCVLLRHLFFFYINFKLIQISNILQTQQKNKQKMDQSSQPKRLSVEEQKVGLQSANIQQQQEEGKGGFTLLKKVKEEVKEEEDPIRNVNQSQSGIDRFKQRGVQPPFTLSTSQFGGAGSLPQPSKPLLGSIMDNIKQSSTLRVVDNKNRSFESQFPGLFLPIQSQKIPAQPTMNTTQNYSKDTTEQKYVPTKVLFARNLPLDATEQDLVRIFSAFGPVFKVLLLINKANAFIEFQTQQAAESCIQCTEDIYLHNQKLYVSFSSRETISSDRVDQRDHIGVNKILLVTINNVRYPVTADTLYTVFSKCGEVLRIVSFPRQLGEQALIEYRTVEQAKVAKFTLEGQGMYGEKGANLMRIQYSERTKLEIGNQTLKAQDYTRQGGQIGSQYNGEGIGMRPSKDEFMGMFNTAYQQIIQGSDAARDQPDELENSSIFSQFDSLQLQPSTQTQDDKAQPSKVLLASNLPISPDVNPQSLFTIFGIYGNVSKIKILFNKRDNALIEFETSEQAHMARDKLNKIPFKAQLLQISFSKHSSINFKSSETAGDSSLQQDFSHSWQHRFRVEGSKNYENIYPPNKTVLFSNLHENLDEETLRGLLSENDLQTPQKINYFKVNHDKGKAPMAFVKFSSISEALEAIVHFHNKNFEGKHIKVSFAKNTI